MEHNFYRGGALRTDLSMRRRVQAVLGADMPMRWSRTTIDLRHQLKGSPATIWCMRVLARAGIQRHVLDFLSPVMFHVEALVYRGDIEYENAQRKGTAADPQWREGIEEILRAYKLDDPVMFSAVAELDDYFRLESSILEGRTPLRAELIPRTCYSRCAGAILLLRFGCRLAGIQPDERLFTLIRHLSAHDEISTDLPSYAEDVSEGLFNVYQLSTWIYGPQAAKHHLQRQGNDILRALRHDITHTDHATLTIFATIMPPMIPLSPRLPSIVPKLLPRALLAHLLKLRIHFHSISKPHRFPKPLTDTKPVAPQHDLEAPRCSRTAARIRLIPIGNSF